MRWGREKDLQGFSKEREGKVPKQLGNTNTGLEGRQNWGDGSESKGIGGRKAEKKPARRLKKKNPTSGRVEKRKKKIAGLGELLANENQSFDDPSQLGGGELKSNAPTVLVPWGGRERKKRTRVVIGGKDQGRNKFAYQRQKTGRNGKNGLMPKGGKKRWVGVPWKPKGKDTCRKCRISHNQGEPRGITGEQPTRSLG